MDVENIVVERKLYDNLEYRKSDIKEIIRTLFEREQAGKFAIPGIPYIFHVSYFSGDPQISGDLQNVMYISSPAFPVCNDVEIVSNLILCDIVDKTALLPMRGSEKGSTVKG